jgi:hypothetical protein
MPPWSNLPGLSRLPGGGPRVANQCLLVTSSVAIEVVTLAIATLLSQGAAI